MRKQKKNLRKANKTIANIKMWCFEVDVGADGKPTAAWLEQRKKGYRGGEGKRHSPSKSKSEGNAPRFSVYYHLETNKPKIFNYIQCRLFYCVWMERLVPHTREFKRLVELIDGGTNVLICGYDGYADGVSLTLDGHYADPVRPFGHELVLYSLLTVKDPRDYPWNRYWRDNGELYDGMFDGGGGGDGGGAQ